MQAGSVDHAVEIETIVARHDDAVFDKGVALDGDGFDIEVTVEGEGEHVQCGDGEVGVASHEVFAQIGGDVDDGLVGDDGVGGIDGDGGVFLAAANDESGKGHKGEDSLFHSRFLNFILNICILYLAVLWGIYLTLFRVLFFPEIFFFVS